MTEAGEKADLKVQNGSEFKWGLCIYYPAQFVEIFKKKLSFCISKNDVNA